jgi:hypothetical protein
MSCSQAMGTICGTNVLKNVDIWPLLNGNPISGYHVKMLHNDPIYSAKWKSHAFESALFGNGDRRQPFMKVRAGFGVRMGHSIGDFNGPPNMELGVHLIADSAIRQNIYAFNSSLIQTT